MKFKKENDRERKLAGKVGNDYNTDNAATIDKFNSINGSGSTAFGGAKSWPSLTLRVSFQAGEEKHRNELAKMLEKTTADFMDNLRAI